jgi:DNA (cytosine-5)-methyltransferase 1
MKKKFIDLFAGTGAFSIALEKTGAYECVFANDMEKSSKETYTLNHGGDTFVHGNLLDIPVSDIPPHDLLCGGFPCQPFSIAGDKKGFDDPRSNVFWKIVEILKHHTPETVILENVKNLCSHDKGNTFRVIAEALQGCGYHIRYEILDTSKMTHVPQHRERIYIVGFRDPTLAEKFTFDFPPVDLQDVRTFFEDAPDKKYYYTDRVKVFDAVDKGVQKEGVIYQYRRYYIRENKSNRCPTLTANMGGGGHNVPLIRTGEGVRKLTPRECFNFQGFPRDFKLPPMSDSALYKLAGNAVSVPVVTQLAEKLKTVVTVST